MQQLFSFMQYLIPSTRTSQIEAELRTEKEEKRFKDLEYKIQYGMRGLREKEDENLLELKEEMEEKYKILEDKLDKILRLLEGKGGVGQEAKWAPTAPLHAITRQASYGGGYGGGLRGRYEPGSERRIFW